MSDTPKTDTMLEYLKSLNWMEFDAVRKYARRMQISDLGTPKLDMIKSFVSVLREERVPQHLQGDGFDWVEA